MLSRVANSLYWLARYLERAENSARWLTVTSNYALELQGVSHAAADECWPVAARLLHSEADRNENPTEILHRLILSADVDNSVLSSVSLARENARSIRDAIASEVWEALNVRYLELQEDADQPRGTREAGRPNRQRVLLRQVLETSHLLQGLRDNTMVRADEWYFLRLGQFIERADNTLRCLDAMFNHPALHVAREAGHSIDTLHLAATLRTATGFEAFARTAPGLTPEAVAEFLLLDARFPRSVEFAIQELVAALHALSGTPVDIFTNEAEQMCGRLVAELRFALIAEILSQGLSTYVQRILGSLTQVGQSIADEYFP